MTATITARISTSTNPAVAGRYFIELSSETARQKLLGTYEADEARTWLTSMTAAAEKVGKRLVIEDETGELYAAEVEAYADDASRPVKAARKTRKNLYAALVDSLDFPTLEDYGFERAAAEDRLTRKPRNPRSLILSV